MVAKRTSPYSAKDEQQLMVELWDPAISDDPYAFVMFVFPWGQKGTPLEHHHGPRTWQKEKLQQIRDTIAKNRNLERQARDMATKGVIYEIFRDATVSGRGSGKSALVAWLIWWFMSTRIGGTAIITANTETQLKSRTWAELGRWHTMALNAHWFERGAMNLKPAEWFEAELKKQLKVDTGYYYAQAQLWSEENPDAFAGVHNHAGILVVMDEASGIPECIWTVTEGFFTEPVVDRYWLVFSNGRRNTGAFFECFHKNRKYWSCLRLNSLTVEGVDNAPLNAIIDKYGADSDEARVEVYGDFPRQGDRQFISRGEVEDAVERQIEPDNWAPLILGVDVARYGDDSSVLRYRQGRDARSIPAKRFKGLDNVELALEVAHEIDTHFPDAVNIDAGNGTGVIDTLRSWGYKVNEVWFGRKSPEPQWGTFGTWMWDEMRQWIKGGCLPGDQSLIDDLTAREYRFMARSDCQIVEPKEEMKKRGFASPDDADALACTFAFKVARKSDPRIPGGKQAGRVAKGVDYDIFGT